MKYTPHLPRVNVNVSKTHPLIELLWLTGGLILLTGLIFLSLGIFTDTIVAKTPLTVENWLGEKALIEHPAEINSPLTTRLNALVADLPADSPLHEYTFKVYLSSSEQINAIALPGGKIVVYRGLIKQVASENELSMVLGHELGHFAHRDHLRGLGRGLGVVLATTFLLGPDSSAGDIVAKTFLKFQADYSQEQERAADVFGINLLNSHYGHVGGGTDFFSRLSIKSASKIPYILASHPHPQDRIDNLNRLIREKNYSSKPAEPLAFTENSL